jgi:hypothetical protein
MSLGGAGEIAVRIGNEAIQIGWYAVTCVDGKLRID